VKPILLVGHDPDERFGVAPAALSAAGVPVLLHTSGLDGQLPSHDEVAGIVVFGGEMNVDMTDRYPFLAEERTLVRNAVDRGIPVLGLCLGAQMLARAMDRPVFPAGLREIGFNVLHPTEAARDDPITSGFVDGDMVFHWHEDTFELPEDATVLATGDDVHLQAFRVGDHAWGLQFHVEVDRPELELWLDLAGEDGVRAWGKTTKQVLAEADRFLDRQEARARELFTAFADVTRRAPLP
jgi:GMP synthase (glutamine-hydrolysing)